MSYILDALRKSDQQRQHGAVPTLLTAQATAAAPKRSAFLFYGLLAAVLVGVGIAIGWLRPWQPEPVAPAAKPIATRSPESDPRQTVPTPLPEPGQPVGTDPVDVAQEQRVMTLAELPLSIQQEIPRMSVSVHAYSSEPRNRLVGINERTLREGGDVAPGLRLEQITPDGMIFSYKGYRFSRGVRSADPKAETR